MDDDAVRELEVYKMLARLGIDLGAGVIPRYGLMSVAVPLAIDEGAASVAFALYQRVPDRDATVDEEIDPELCGALTAISTRH
jgi:hypothetical protein